MTLRCARAAPAGTEGKPYCNDFGFVVDNYDEAKVNAELERRGIAGNAGACGGDFVLLMELGVLTTQ
jgi:hypothetical protein